MRLEFEGCGDDTFGEYATFKDDHDNCASGKPITYKVIGPNGEEFLVVGQYSPGLVSGCWLIGVAPSDESKPIPDWEIYFQKAKRGYTPQLVIKAPEGTKIQHLPEVGRSSTTPR